MADALQGKACALPRSWFFDDAFEQLRARSPIGKDFPPCLAGSSTVRRPSTAATVEIVRVIASYTMMLHSPTLLRDCCARGNSSCRATVFRRLCCPMACHFPEEGQLFAGREFARAPHPAPSRLHPVAVASSDKSHFPTCQSCWQACHDPSAAGTQKNPC